MPKVLIISYYWPPAGGVSVHRALKWAKFLPAFGWDPVIYTAENAQYPFCDEKYAEKIPENLEVIKHPICEVQTLFKRVSGRKKDHALVSPFQVRNEKSKEIDRIAIWIRSNFFIPDARMLWISPSVKFLKTYLKEHPVDAIISTGPPHSSNMIACKLHAATGIPWLADFQDPWTQADYYRLLSLTKMADKKHKRMEQEIFARANSITTVSPTWARDLECIGAKNVTPLYFGFDEEDFKTIKPQNDAYFNIVHAGMLGFDRLPDILFRVLAEMKHEDAVFAERLRIRLAGMVDYSVKESIAKNGLKEHTDYMGSISLDEAYRLNFSGDLLLLLLNKAHNAKGRVPGKLFEYLVANRPILCLGPDDSDVASIIEKTSSGIVSDYDDFNRLKSFMTERFSDFIEGKFTCDTHNVKKYAVRTQTEQLAQILDTITT